MDKVKSFDKALKKLNIEDYGERIFNSNSHGELLHLSDYIFIANLTEDMTWFRDWFIEVVESAEKHWERPQSIFQHIFKVLSENIEAAL